MNKLEAITKLAEYDHAILSPEEAAAIAEPFGVEPYIATYQDSRSEFKGITLCGDANASALRRTKRKDYA